MNIKIKIQDGSYSITSEGKVFSERRGIYLKPWLNTGYMHVKLKGKNYKVHRLVAEAFIDNPNKHPQVNHKDGVKTNNNVNNLEWCTAKENVAHAWVMGLCDGKKPEGFCKGEFNHRSKLREEDIPFIRHWLESGYRQKEIAEAFGVGRKAITKIKAGERWAHV